MLTVCTSCVAANDVTKQKDLSGFYRNLLAQNMSKASYNVQAVSKESEEPDHIGQSAESTPVCENKEEKAEGELKAADEQTDRHGKMRPRKRKDMEGKEKLVSLEDENDNQKRNEDQDPTEGHRLGRSSDQIVIEEKTPPSQIEERNGKSNLTEANRKTEGTNPSKIERRNTENSVAAARERYLARKLAATSQNQCKESS